MARGDWTFRTPDGHDPSNFFPDEPRVETEEERAAGRARRLALAGALVGAVCAECGVSLAGYEASLPCKGVSEVDGVYTGGRRITRRTEARAIEYREAAKKIAAEARRKRAVVRHRAVVVEQLMAAGDGRSREEAEAEYERRLGLGHYADWVYGGTEARGREDS